MERIRTINEAVQMIRKEDPESRISAYMIRQLAYNEKIRSIKSDSKVVIDFDHCLHSYKAKNTTRLWNK